MTLAIDSLLWCMAQVTLVALLAGVVCALLRRWSAEGHAVVPAAGLAAIAVLTICAFLPWPGWWRFGPELHLAGGAALQEDTLPRAEPAAEPAADSSGVAEPADEFAPVATVEQAFSARTSQETRPTAPTAASPPAAPATMATDTPFDAAPQQTAWLPLVLLAILASGVLAGLSQLVGGLISVRACRRASRTLDDASLSEMLDVLRAELGLTRGVELRESEYLATAATVGWRRPVILLPRSWRGWSEDQRRAVLAHELAHVARGDYLACILAQLSLALHFYHPLVHWLAARLRLEQELAADAAAAELSGGRRSYLTALAELALHTSEQPLGWPAHTFLPTRGTFLRRIEMLRDSQPVLTKGSPRHWPAKWLAVGVLVVGAAVIAGLRGGPATSPFDQAALAQAPAGAAPNGAIDLTHVSNDARMIVAVRPAAVFAHEQLRQGLVDFAASGPPALKLLAIEQLDQLTVVGPADGEILILRFRQPVEPDAIAKATGNEMVELGKQPQDAAGRAGTRYFYARPEPNTYILGYSPAVVRRHATSRRKGQPALAAGEAWKKVEKGAIVVAFDMEFVREEIEEIPERGPARQLLVEFGALAPLWKDSEYVAAGVIVEGKTVHFRAVATCASAELAENVADTAGAAVTLSRNTLRSVREREQVIPGVARLLMETADGLLKTIKVERSDSLVIAQTSTPLPEVESAAARDLATAVAQARVTAHQQVSANNLKQIAIALHNYHDTYKRFPPPVLYGRDGKGEVPHSWRVALLPFVGHPELYNAYKFDEPWDSEANKRILAQMPPVYRHPLDDPRSTNAAYFVLRPEKLQSAKEVRIEAGSFEGASDEAFEGGAAGGAAPPDVGTVRAIVAGLAAPQGGFATAFADKDGMSLGQIADGTSNVIAVVEAKRDIPWTKPEDILFDPAKDPPKLGGYFAEGFHAAFCDGAVKFIDHKLDPKVLKLLIMPQDGTPTPNF